MLCHELDGLADFVYEVLEFSQIWANLSPVMDLTNGDSGTVLKYSASLNHVDDNSPILEMV